MKNKLLIILVLLLFVGCGKTSEKPIESKKPNPLYTLESIAREVINDELIRLYAVLRNTSQNDAVIKSAKLLLVNPETNKLSYEQEKDYKHAFNVGEDVLISFDIPATANNNSYISVILTYDSEVKSKDKQKKYNEINAYVSKRDVNYLENKSTVILTVSFNNSKKISKLKVITHNENDFPSCIAYLDVNETVDPLKEYTYEFECDPGINIDGYITFEI